MSKEVESCFPLFERGKHTKRVKRNYK